MKKNKLNFYHKCAGHTGAYSPAEVRKWTDTFPVGLRFLKDAKTFALLQAVFIKVTVNISICWKIKGNFIGLCHIQQRHPLNKRRQKSPVREKLKKHESRPLMST